MATARHVLIDDRDQWHHLHAADTAIERLGGPHRLSRRRVTVTGRRSTAPAAPGATHASAIEVEDLQADEGVASGSAQSAVVGPQPWLTVLCRFADSTAVTPRPKSYFHGLMGSASPGLDHYWNEVSYGRIDLTGSVVAGWYNLPRPRSYYVYATGAGGVERVDFQRTIEDCAGAAADDVHLPDFVGINLVFNEALDCCSWGGGATLSHAGQPRHYRVTWLPPWAYSQQSIVAHEMGHGFGLPHSSGPYTSAYDSDWDPMSGGGVCPPGDPVYGCVAVHTIAHHKGLLGWIPPSRTFTPSPGIDGTIVLERLGKPTGAGYLMAQVPIPGAFAEYYSLETRLFTGYDARAPGQAVLIHRVDPARGDRAARVVDGSNNGNPNDAGAMWLPGEVFVDPASGISVVVEGATGSAFRLTILTAGVHLVVVRAGAGTGTVTSTPGAIACGSTCGAGYEAGATVSLTAAADAGSALSGWSGCDAVAGRVCTVVMNATRSVRATFARRARLSVRVVGSGAVRTVPAGIACGSVCGATYAIGTPVRLLARPGPDQIFAGWTGSADCSDGVLSMAGDVVCTATFRAGPDLVVSEVGNPPAALRPGRTFAIGDTVENQGPVGSGSFHVRFYLSADASRGHGDPMLLGTRVVSGLPAGAASAGRTSVRVPSNVAPGIYHLVACADDTNVVRESDETQNCRASARRVAVSRRQ
jgi:hypothetical protein